MVSLADILGASILVVDDKEANVRLLEGALRQTGYTSVHATTQPNEVCELHRKNRYSLILLGICAVAAAGWIALSDGLIDRNGKPIGTDFASFYAAGSLALGGVALAGLLLGLSTLTTAPVEGLARQGFLGAFAAPEAKGANGSNGSGAG